MKKIIYLIFCGFFVLTILFVGISMGQGEDVLKKRFRLVKEKYNFAKWCPETGKVIPGIEISKKILPQLTKMRKVWQKDNYSIKKIQETTYSIIRKWWKLEDNQFEVTMVVCPTLNAAKDYLIYYYSDTQRESPLIKQQGQKIGLDIGNVCFVTKIKQEENLSTVDIIRHNVLLIMRAEGSFMEELGNIARILDKLLLKKKPVKSLLQLKEIPTITHFSCQKKKINPGEKILLHLQVRNPKERELRYFWRISGGGVEKDPRGNFIYYGGEEGKHTITVTVLNSIGLHDSKFLKIDVSPSK